MITLYDFPLSGHGHRVRLFLSILGLDNNNITVDLANGEQRNETFKNLNPFSHVPVLDDDGFVIRDSNAILVYLAEKYAPQYYPASPEKRARIQEWLSVATREIATAPAAARLVNVFGAKLDHPKLIEQSHQLFKIIEQHLSGREWLAIDDVSIADISAYTYIAHAPEGDVSLEAYPAIRAWLQRVESLSGFTPMPKTA